MQLGTPCPPRAGAGLASNHCAASVCCVRGLRVWVSPQASPAPSRN